MGFILAHEIITLAVTITYHTYLERYIFSLFDDICLNTIGQELRKIRINY